MRHTPRLLALLIAASSILSAATWTGLGDGVSWNDADNWSDNSPPSAEDPVWDIGEGASVLLDDAAPGGAVIKRGEGTLLWGPMASAASVEVQAGAFDFAQGMIWPEMTLTGGTLLGNIIESSTLVTGGTLAARAEGPLTLVGGPVMNVNVSAAYSLTLVGATVQGYLLAESSIWLADWAGPSRIDGHLHLAAGSALAWSLQDPSAFLPLIVTGELSSDYEMRLYFGLVDWSAPYWDQPREFLFVDAWEGSIVTATLTPDPYAGNDGEGTWGVVRDATGDIAMRWTPIITSQLQTAPIPEASSAPWAALAAVGVVLRRRFAQA